MADLLHDRVVAAVGDAYDVEAEIGRGGSAVVYRATDVRLRRKVALKVLPPELAYRDDVRSRFLREAQMAAQLSHPNIVPIYAVDERDGLVYFVMCLVEGGSVASLLRDTPRPSTEVVRRVLRETADALAYAHARGVIHRDIKPDNILLDGDSGRVMVTDFGIARALEGADQRLTVTGIAVGTPAYMSPEQALGERDVDARSDLYSLGVVGYLMLAGELPFRATNTPAMLMKHISEPPAPLGARRPDVPPPLREAIERALAKKPEDRWPSAAAMRDALRERPGGGSAPGWAAAPPAPAPNPHAAPHLALHEAARGARPPAAPAGDPFPALPPRPDFPQHAGTGNSREVWRQQQKLWREQVRAQRQGRAPGAAGAVGAPAVPPAPMPPGVPGPPPAPPAGYDYLAAGGVLEGPELERRFRAFRRDAGTKLGVLAFLAFINLITFPFPWVIFVMMGMRGKLQPRWQELRAAGVTGHDLWHGRLPVHLGGGDPRAARLQARQQAMAARAEAIAQARHGRKLVHWRDPAALERRVHRFRRAALVGGNAFGVAAASLAIGAPAGIEALIAPFVIGSAVAGGAGIYAAVSGRRIRKAGLRLRDMLKRDWRTRLRAADPRPRAAVLEEELARLVPPEVVVGPHGETVRRALADRAEVREAFARMSETDRAMLPDVSATVDALVERVVMLAQALHRLDEDHPSAMLAELETRLADATAAGATGPDAERRLGLLQRQRATLQDLVQRRATLAGQLESATLVLQSVRLDLLKLRSAGIQSALDDVTSATQQARALSRDIGHVLDAAAEVRAL